MGSISAPIRPVDVKYVVGISGYFQKDLVAVRQSLRYSPLVDNITPVTPGFRKVVQPGQIISVLIFLPDGTVAIGECAGVIFAGAAARDPPLVPEDHLPFLNAVIRPWLLSCDLSGFRENAVFADNPWPELGDRNLHTAVRYGITQALLAATALVHRCTLAEIISSEWNTPICRSTVDILASCHRDDHLQLDRMIMKEASMLPHASFVHVNDVGPRGALLLAYVERVARRVQQTGAANYRPRLHFDLYGTLGDTFDDNDGLVNFLQQLSHAARPYDLLIESPVVAASRAAQLERLGTLRQILAQRAVPVKLVADEWCNTLEDIRAFVDGGVTDYVQIKMPDLGGINNSIEAVLYCHSKGIGCCLGGSANETDISARITAQVALATGPQFMLSKPGIGADEGLMILTNEMLRTLALVQRSKDAAGCS